MRRMSRFRLALALAVGAAACSDSAGPGGPGTPALPGTIRSLAQLFLVHRAAGALAVDLSTTFYAVRGQGREGVLYYRSPTGQPMEEFARLKLSDKTLLANPDGSPVAQGDSVLITMRVVDPALLLVEFSPSGLRFDPSEPAELEIRYAEADDDFNEDGLHDGRDAQIEAELGIWRQETPLDPFVRLNSTLVTMSKSARSNITGFTRYALAY